MSTTVSLLAELPQDLHTALMLYLEDHLDWDQDRLFTAALSLFLMQNHQPNQQPPEPYSSLQEIDQQQSEEYSVPYSAPTWSSGGILPLVQMMVNLEADEPGNTLRIIDPALPETVNYLSFKNLRVGPTLLDLEFERFGSTTACRVSKKRGDLRVVIEAQ